MMPSSFKAEHDLEKRRQESASVRQRYPDRVPIIVERAAGSKVAEIDKKKFLVPQDLTVGQFCYVVRRRIKLEPEQALYLMTESGTMPATGSLVSQLFSEHTDEDGFLYLVYAGENTFG